MNKLQFLIPLLLLVLIVLIPSMEVLGQCAVGPLGDNGCCLVPGSCFGSAGPLGCFNCVDVPFDGGLSALMLAGVAYGAKRLYGKK